MEEFFPHHDHHDHRADARTTFPDRRGSPGAGGVRPGIDPPVPGRIRFSERAGDIVGGVALGVILVGLVWIAAGLS